METTKYTSKDFASTEEVRWCPGCDDYVILRTMQKALPEMGVAREDFVQGKKDRMSEFNTFVENRVKENPEMQIELKMLQASFFEDTFQYKNAIRNFTQNLSISV